MENKTQNQTVIDEWRQSILDFHIPRWEELPELELYMDQVVSLVSKYLQVFFAAGEKPVTATMINNYVKIGLVPRPVRKKYTREQLAFLIVVCIAKQVLSIAEIRRLVAYQTRNGGLRKAYNYFCAEQEAALKAAVSQLNNLNATGTIAEGLGLLESVPIDEVRTEENLALKMAVFAFASKALSVKLIQSYEAEKGGKQ